MSTKNLCSLLAVISGLCYGFDVSAQSDIDRATNKSALQNLSQQLKLRGEEQKRYAEAVARRNGQPVRRVLPNGTVMEIQRISPDGRPVFYITNNVDAADTVSTDELWPGGSTGLNLDGSGMTVAEWDDAAVLDTHVEFTGRVTQVDSPATFSDHSTHVAGTLIAAGVNPIAKGMAFGANLDAYDWVNDSAEMAAAAAGGLLLSNHSYGDAAGWLLIDPLVSPWVWWWLGGPLDTDIEDPNFGYYNSDSQTWDQIAFDAPYYLIVKSAGNDRDDVGPLPGDPYDVVDQDGNFLFESTLARSIDCAPAGYDCVPTKSTAKNILTVGAVDDVPGGYHAFPGPPSVVMSIFSGWGPTDDGRIKPDLVANGIALTSPVTLPFPFEYFPFDGTSMSAPNVTGSLLLLQEYYQDQNGGSSMRSSTLKALAIHTADEAGDADGPDYKFGWGLLNTKSAAKVITEDGGGYRVIEDVLAAAPGSANEVQINVNEPDAVITATLVWTDPPGTPAAVSVDPPDIMLVNDLDLRIRSAGSTHLPWVLNPATPEVAATTGDNFRDNVEQVVINGGGPGAYFVEVSHKGTLLGGIAQNYSLIISVVPRVVGGVVTIEDADFDGGLPAGWEIVTTSGGVEWIIDDLPPGNQTGGSGKFAFVNYDFVVPADTELRTPSFDMSTVSSVSLSFRTHFFWDFLEQVTVDVSSDGGTVWSTAWFRLGQNEPGPSSQIVDLTSLAAGNSSVIVRFRFDSVGDFQGNIWQVDDVTITASGGELAGDICGGNYNLPKDQWRFISLPCDPGVSNTASDIFGDDLLPGDFGIRWSAYGRDEANDQWWVFPDANTPLTQGEGYFLFSLDDAVLDMTGTVTPLMNSPDCPSPDNNCFEIPLVKPVDALSQLQNALGHPLPYPVDWANFRIRAVGDPASPLTPSAADALNYVSKVTYKYSGAAYLPFDDVTPGYDEGKLGAFDAFWVKTLGDSLNTGDLTLLVPNIRSPGIITTSAAASTIESQASGANLPENSDPSKSPPGLAKREAHRQSHRKAKQKDEEWYVRLTVEALSEGLVDDGNILGQLLDSEIGFDEHDLLEPSPFVPYLTIIFPQDSWGENANDYTSDFHPVTGKKEVDEWFFDVLSDQAGREITLTWTGPEEALQMSLLTDLESGEVIEADSRGSHTFIMNGDRRHFSWEYEKRPGNSKRKK